jgi:hypothetical protein
VQKADYPKILLAAPAAHSGFSLALPDNPDGIAATFGHVSPAVGAYRYAKPKGLGPKRLLALPCYWQNQGGA